ncbi:hypothetical protein TI04_09775 [Achromatium sp. WMS2]|nr:hypothetical protein TI04_09775 [Achromatium sp. WMS2]
MSIPEPAPKKVVDDCGFLRYATLLEDVHIPWVASHPAHFCRFTLTIIRGNVSPPAFAVSQLTEVGSGSFDASSQTVESTGNGRFHVDITPTELLGSCPEGAFAMDLKVRAKATNGIYRIPSYDAEAIRGFALAPARAP